MTDHTEYAHPLVPAEGGARFMSEIVTANPNLFDGQKAKAFQEFVLAHVSRAHLNMWEDRHVMAAWDVKQRTIRWRLTEQGEKEGEKLHRKFNPPSEGEIAINAWADDTLTGQVQTARQHPATCCRALKMSMRASLSVRTNNASSCAC